MMHTALSIFYGLALAVIYAQPLIITLFAWRYWKSPMRTPYEQHLAPEAEQDRRVTKGCHSGKHFEI